MKLKFRLVYAGIICAVIIYFLIAVGLNTYGSVIAGLIAGFIVIYLTKESKTIHEQMTENVPQEELSEDEKLN